MPKSDAFERRLESIAELVHELEAAADPRLRATARELVQLLMELHGAGLERTLEIIHSAGEPGGKIIDSLARDKSVASLLVLYGLHPVDLETRVMQGVEKARSDLRSRGGELDFVGFSDGTVRLRLHANGQGCGSTAEALKAVVEEAMYEAAPDVASLVIEGAEEKHSFVPLTTLISNGHAAVAQGKS
jgi:Fe-S cluster biogenesis protein NfuA